MKYFSSRIRGGKIPFYTSVAIVLLTACHSKHALFQLVPSGQSGIVFNNVITEKDSMNILDYEYIYNGGGVAIGDFNNDGLQDVYFTGNMVPNQLYLNQGKMKFREVSEEAHVTGEGKWCTGVTTVDINNDGWLDIYVCASTKSGANERENLLYVNQGLNKKEIPIFKEMAKEYGVNDNGHSMMAAFFDYDNDGDLDLYVLTNQIDSARYPNIFRPKKTDGSNPNTDRLYRCDWSDSLHHAVYTNVSKQAGITIEGFGLGLNITDINQDGWKDIYVTNDYVTNDLLYINNHDGTFTNKADDYFKHTSFSAMGNDVNDINNDGLADIIALDMQPHDNLRKKMMLNANNYTAYINHKEFGYQHEYVRNTLQLNQGPRRLGNDTIGDPIFSDIAIASGVAATDWSWTPMVVDFDNDGYRDLIVTNGFPKDITDHDFVSFWNQVGNVASRSYLLERIPQVKISNFAYKNNGDLTFSDMTESWGIKIPSFSNGAAYADLDNDGDLDCVVNNINDKAFLFENTLNEGRDEHKIHYLRFQFNGEAPNRMGLGTWVKLYYDHGKQQVYENTVCRGYLSSVENVAHFGLGPVAMVDSVKIIWPNGKQQTLRNVKADQVVIADIAHANETAPATSPPPAPLYTDVTQQLKISLLQPEEDFIDFNIQKLLPHKLSQFGPALAVGDIDGNGTQDLVVGGAQHCKAKFLLQDPKGGFSLKDLLPGKEGADKMSEDEGMLLFDADGDGDLDLYIVSGSCENPPGSPFYKDRFYLNTGKGKFVLDSAALPPLVTSKSCIKAADFDHDGDLDLFIGGRVEPGSYPKPVNSYVLRNDSKNGRVQFTDITPTFAKNMMHLGLVCDALWTDFDNDGWVDLLLCGEWMPLTFFRNNKGHFENITAQTGIANQVGLWTSLVAGDFDNDGDMDYIAGNNGVNTYYRGSDQYPIGIYAKDFDKNGSFDAIPTVFFPDSAGKLREYPAHTRDDLIKQMISMRAKFPKYHDFAMATIHELLSADDRKDALIYHANNVSSCYIENKGQGQFAIHPLPFLAQLAPLNGMVVQDADGDGNLDVVINGNDFGAEVSVGRYDALNGLVLKGNGKGQFKPLAIAQSGLFIPGDGKALVTLVNTKREVLLAASQNQGPVKFFRNNGLSKILPLQNTDAIAYIHYKNGTTRKEELYYGQSFLSQSGRFLKLDGEVRTVELIDFKGKKRNVLL